MTFLARPPLRFLSATPEDEGFLLTLRNDPEVRAVSRTQAPVSPDEHRAWFYRVLADPTRHLYTAWVDDARVGVVRLDRTEGDEREVEVSITLTPEARNRGLGPLVLGGAMEEAARRGYASVQATVLPNNPRSLRAFLSAGFLPADPVLLRRRAEST